ncbi:MAG: FlaD/FlaE family flagellar protein, partial [Halanaeroarchaeum sp.]
MTPNTRDYDPEELRTAARDDSDGKDAAELREKIAQEDVEFVGSIESKQVKELLLLESGIDPEELTRPYLERLPDDYAARLTVFEWLDFVLGRAGVHRTLEALDYYESIGWISESVSDDLRDHVRAFQDVANGKESAELDVEDHVLSLVYVARLT